MNHLQISNPIVLEFDEISKTSEIMEFYKAICKNSNFINFNAPFNNRDDSYVIFTKIQNFKREIQTDNIVLVVSVIESEKELQQIEVSIGTEIYFLDWDSLKIYETYQINVVRITRYLGQFVIERSKNVFFKGAQGMYVYYLYTETLKGKIDLRVVCFSSSANRVKKYVNQIFDHNELKREKKIPIQMCVPQDYLKE